MRERLRDEWIHLLLERQFDIDADGAAGALSGSAECAPSLAACIMPGPPPVRMSQPMPINSAASCLYTVIGGSAGLRRAEPKMVTR